MRTAKEILKKNTTGYRGAIKQSDAIKAMTEYTDQFRLKWNTFTSDRSLDPKFGEYVFIVSQYKPNVPILVLWEDLDEVIEGDLWIYFKDIRPA